MHFNGKLEYSFIADGCVVAVENLPAACDEDDLFDLFCQTGHVRFMYKIPGETHGELQPLLCLSFTYKINTHGSPLVLYRSLNIRQF